MAQKQNAVEKLEVIKLRRAELELILMERDVKILQETEKANRLTLEQQERNVAADRAATEMVQAGCAHHKGGSNLDGFYKGSAEHFSVIRHTYPVPFMREFPTCTGTVIHCQRCHKEWNEGDPNYADALRFNTNNMPSGNPLFTVTYHPGPRSVAA